jgi:hypothetical protein
VSTQAQIVTLSFTATDSPAGVKNVFGSFRSPSHIPTSSCTGEIPVAGDRFSGLFQCTIAIPLHAEPGVWELFFVRPTDQTGNSVAHTIATGLQSLGFPFQLDVVDGGGSPPP